jgi:hypothetical protein
MAASTQNWFNQPLNALRVVYVCDWLPPDFGAVGQYSLQFSRDRAAQGQDVLLVGLSSEAPSIETELHGDGRVTIWKLHAGTYKKSSLVSRFGWTAVINLRLMIHLFLPFLRCQELIFTGSPPFMVHWIAPLNLLLRKKVIYRITDFYPECLMATDQRVSLPLRLLHGITMFWRRRIPVMEVLGEDQRLRLNHMGITDDRIQMKRDPAPIAIPPNTKPISVPDALAGYIVLLYSGNYGVAHEYETFVSGYIKHHREGSGKVALWLNAVGSTADRVEQRLREAGVPVHRGKPVPLDELPQLLVTPHAHLITLRDSFVGYVMPSKVYGCIESNRQILYIGSKQSDVHLLCARDMDSVNYHQLNVGDIDGVGRVLDEMAASSCVPAENVT